MLKLIKIGYPLLGSALCGCYEMRPTSGGGKFTVLPEDGVRALNPEDSALPSGYRIEAVATGL